MAQTEFGAQLLESSENDAELSSGQPFSGTWTHDTPKLPTLSVRWERPSGAIFRKQSSQGPLNPHSMVSQRR